MPVRHGRLKRHSPSAGLIKLIATGAAVILVASTSIAAFAALDVASSANTVHLAQAPTAKKTAATAAQHSSVGEVNLLLVGTDTRTGQGGAYSSQSELAGSSGAGNNDVNILLHIAANHKSVSVVSIPRDLEIPFPDCPNGSGGTTPATGQAMMNTALLRGGLSCAVLATEQLTGLQIPYAAEISFDGTTAMSDALGGVTVCLASPVVDSYTNPPLNLSAGQHTLVGPQALSFLRSRHGVGDGSDLGRISNQQVYMSALVRQVLKSSTFENPLTLYRVAKAAVSNMTLSDTLANPSLLISILNAVRGVGTSNIVFLQYPTIADPANVNRVVPNPTAAGALNTALDHDQPVALTGTTGVGSQAQSTPAPVAAAAPAATAAATPRATAAGGTATPSAAPAPTSATVALPSTVTGQTAAQQTCTRGNNL